MHDQPNSDEGRVGPLDNTVERLTHEVASLKLELATISSALRELQHQSSPRRMPVAAKPPAIDPPLKPTMAPAAVVVLLAAGLLSWQLIATPRPVQGSDQSLNMVSVLPPPAADNQLPPLAPPSTEPPISPLVKPTIYKGTLTVTADRPGATVFVNRKDMGPAPVRVRNLRAGAHLVWVEHDGYRRWTRVVTVPAERVTRVAADLEPVGPQ